MTQETDFLKGRRILVVDDEIDILETIEDILDNAVLDCAKDYESASNLIKANHYDLAILDIMGVDGLTLLEEAVAKEIPTVMLTAHAINRDTLMASIRKGAIAYLPKEKLAELDILLSRLLSAKERGEPPWRLLFEELGDYFNQRFGDDWQDRDRKFWTEFERTYQVGRGIRERLLHDPNITQRGI